ncbi:MAG: EI24 domain-containing protein [Sphingomonadaceae bacterium]
MGAVLRSCGRAMLSFMHGKMIMLSLAPFVLSVALWAGLLYLGLQPLIDWVQSLFAEYGLFSYTSGWLAGLGLGMLKTVVVPLIAMLLLLPLMVLTALLFIGVAAMPAIGRHVGLRHFPQLEQRHGGSLLGSVLTTLGTMLSFIVLWLLSLPLYVFPPLAVAVQALLWGWLTSRVMTYDALADYASADERRALLQQQRWPLLAIGVVSGLAGAVPGLLWLGGTALSVVLFPFLAAASIWLYVAIFIFTGLGFVFFGLEALARLRAADGTAVAPQALEL